MKFLHGKYNLSYDGIQPWKSVIPPSQDGIKNVPASYKRDKKFMKKWR